MALLREIALFGWALVVTLGSFWVYFDGLERVSNLEANLWAVTVLLAGGFALFVGPPEAIAVALAAVLSYGIRTRLIRSGHFG